MQSGIWHFLLIHPAQTCLPGPNLQGWLPREKTSLRLWDGVESYRPLPSGRAECMRSRRGTPARSLPGLIPGVPSLLRAVPRQGRLDPLAHPVPRHTHTHNGGKGPSEVKLGRRTLCLLVKTFGNVCTPLRLL